MKKDLEYAQWQLNKKRDRPFLGEQKLISSVLSFSGKGKG